MQGGATRISLLSTCSPSNAPSSGPRKATSALPSSPSLPSLPSPPGAPASASPSTTTSEPRPPRRSTTSPTSSSGRWGRCGRRRHSPRGRQEGRVSCGAIAYQTDADGTSWRRCVGPSAPDRYVLLDPTLPKSGRFVSRWGFRLSCLRTRSCPGGFHRWSGARRPAGGRGEPAIFSPAWLRGFAPPTTRLRKGHTAGWALGRP